MSEVQVSTPRTEFRTGVSKRYPVIEEICWYCGILQR